MEIVKEKSLGDLRAAFDTGQDRGDESFAPPPEPQGGFADGLGRHANNPQQPRVNGWSIVAGDGTEYTVSSCETRIKGQFEKEWLRRNAAQAIKEVGEEFGQEMMEHALDKFVEERAEGKYNFGSEHCIKALIGLPGTVFYLYLILRRCHPKITEDDARKLLMTERKQCSAAIKWSLGNWLGSTPDGEASGTESPSVERAAMPNRRTKEELMAEAGDLPR